MVLLTLRALRPGPSRLQLASAIHSDLFTFYPLHLLSIIYGPIRYVTGDGISAYFATLAVYTHWKSITLHAPTRYYSCAVLFTRPPWSNHHSGVVLCILPSVIRLSAFLYISLCQFSLLLSKHCYAYFLRHFVVIVCGENF